MRAQTNLANWSRPRVTLIIRLVEIQRNIRVRMAILKDSGFAFQKEGFQHPLATRLPPPHAKIKVSAYDCSTVNYQT